jgi:uncharacterized protein with GYD domain
MAIYITQGKFTREAVQGMLANPEDRKAAVAALAESSGGRLVEYYITLGEYDFLIITEGPDDGSSILSSAVVAGATGGVENLTTTVAYTTAQFKESLEKAGGIAAQFQTAGGV